MGTRGLIGFIINGARKGVFNHFDSFPRGLGNGVIEFIMSLNKDEIKDTAAKVKKASTPSLVWLEEDEKNYTRHNRDLLDRVKAGQTTVVDESDFQYDTFCEYAYFVDFESELVEVHCGLEDWAVWKFGELAPDCFEDIHEILEKQEERRQRQTTET